MVYCFALAHLQMPWSNPTKVIKQSILGVVVHSLESILELSIGTAFRELLEEDLLLPASQASQRRPLPGNVGAVGRDGGSVQLRNWHLR